MAAVQGSGRSGDGVGDGLVDGIEHSWLGPLRRYGTDQLLGHVEIDPRVRPARMNGRTDAEVLVTVGLRMAGPELEIVLESAAERIRAALADLENIKTSAVAHAPEEWRQHYLGVEASPLSERLFLEGFAVTSPTEMEVSFDFGDLDMLVVRLGIGGRVQSAYLVA